jgi:hypothetical protein
MKLQQEGVKKMTKIFSLGFLTYLLGNEPWTYSKLSTKKRKSIVKLNPL